MRTTRNSGEIGANLAAAFIVALGLILSCHYAIQTPVWQYSDEPAHYNYGFALASTGQLVEIKAGDWGLQSLPGAWDWPASYESPAMGHGYWRVPCWG